MANLKVCLVFHGETDRPCETDLPCKTMVIPQVLVEFVQFVTVNICNNDVKELTHLKALRRVWYVN